MTRRLYENLAIYRAELDRCFGIANKELDFRLESVLFPDSSEKAKAEKRISQTVVAQPALFVVEYSLARTLSAIGVEPRGMLGHSVSEYVAACLAGVFTLESAIKIVVKRGQLVQGLPEGSMLAVALPEKEVASLLDERISLGSTIGSNQCVVSGYSESVDQLRRKLVAQGIECKRVKVTRAFHSIMLDPVLEEFGEFVDKQKRNEPTLAFISGVNGEWADPVSVQSSEYWVRQLREPVRFYEGAGTLAAGSNDVLLEVGNGTMLTSLVRRHPRIENRLKCLSLGPSVYSKVDELEFLSKSLDTLESIGFTIDKSILGDSGQLNGAESSAREGPLDGTVDTSGTIEEGDEWEPIIAKHFFGILGCEPDSVSSDFLELGGNSLMAMQVISRIRKELGVAIPIKSFFENPTVESLTKTARKLANSPLDSSARPSGTADACAHSESSSDGRGRKMEEKLEVPGAPSNALGSEKAEMEFSLFFFSGDESAYPEDKYKLVMEGARFADRNGFDAVWVPERHFNKFGGLYPNPSVLGAAIAASTRQINIRGGSVVAPLHHPVRVAEEWSVLDNLSRGRVGIAFGSGFHPNDFLLAPEAFADRKEKMFESIASIRKLWAGGMLRGQGGTGEEIDVPLYPKPYSKELPVWLATTRSPDTFKEAGEIGSNVLTALLRMTVSELGERIEVYRKALERNGRDPKSGIVTLMLHTFVGPDMDYVRSQVEAPLKAYLRSHMEHTKAVALEKSGGSATELSPDEEEALLDHAFERYFEHNALMGTEEHCTAMVDKLKAAGVDEVACLIDFGVAFDSLMGSLESLNRLRIRTNGTKASKPGEMPSPIVGNERDATGEYSLSVGQRRLWFFNQFESDSGAYNLKFALRLKGPLDRAALESALGEVVSRHEALRTRIELRGGNPIQVVESAGVAQWELRYFESEYTAIEDKRLSEDLLDEVHKPFDLSTGPLFRVSLHALSESDAILVFVAHHIISDGWSLSILRNEILDFYRSAAKGVSPTSKALAGGYSEFCERSDGEEAGISDDLEYWKQRLEGVDPFLEIPTDFARPARQTYSGSEKRAALPEKLTQQLAGIGKECGVSLFTVLLTAFQTLLHRYSGQRDIVVGVPTAGRESPELETVVGLFVNNLPLRIEFGEDFSFRELIEEVNNHCLDAFAHQRVPFEALVEAFDNERDVRRQPLFQVMFAYQNFPTGHPSLENMEVEDFPLGSRTSLFDLSLYVYEVEAALSLKLQYSTGLFREATIERMLNNFQALLHGIVENPSQGVADLPIVAPEEERRILAEWNNAERNFKNDVYTHDLITAAAARQGERTAAIFPATGNAPEIKLSYSSLIEDANRIANFLIKKGVGPEVVVGLSLDRRELMLSCLLGIMKAGGAYLPLDATLPDDRQRFMLQDAGAKFLIADSERGKFLAEECVQFLEAETLMNRVSNESAEEPDVPVYEDTLAYIIYTSGSTGTPKGVEICHGPLANFLQSMRDTPGLARDDRLLAITTISFDIAVLELYLPLIVGATVVVGDARSSNDGQRIRELLSKYEITVMQGTPSTWRLLMESGWQGDPGIMLLCGGEALDDALADRLNQMSGKLWNLYGPTETTVWSSCYDMTDGGPVFVGRPIANTKLFVLDGNYRPVPIGVPGDLYIGGKGLARGYRDRPELTEQSFIELSAIGEGRVYKTGDRAKWNEEGKLEYLGRSDSQIKLRGYRIELGEIESALSSHDDVIEAAVVLRGEEESDQRLMGFVSTRYKAVLPSELQDYVARSLPSYMVPSRVVVLDALPKTPNGKIDRKRLPQSLETIEGETESSLSPQTATESRLAAIWGRILGLRNVGLNDSFFRIGGHSLTSIKLISAVNEELSLDLQVVSLFENPTLGEFSKVVEDELRNATANSIASSLEGASIGEFRVRDEKQLSLFPKDEKFLRGTKNRILQLVARVSPNALRIRLHRWRGVEIGERVGIGYDSIIETSCPWLVSIGDRSRIGMRVTIIGHFAEMENALASESKHTVIIEEDVWIGPSVTILPNVTIGRGSVVAAGSTVSMSVPPGTFVQGNPAKPVARCRVPLTRDVTYEQFIQNLEPVTAAD